MKELSVQTEENAAAPEGQAACGAGENEDSSCAYCAGSAGRGGEDDDDDDDEESPKARGIRIITGGIIFALAWYITEFTSVIPHSGHHSLIVFVMFFIPYIILAWPVLKESVEHISRGQVFDENFLMMIASIGAFGVREYHEAVAVMLFYQIGEFFEDVAVGRSHDSVKALLAIKPDSAVVIRDGKEVETAPEDVHAGEVIVVRPGERVPLDGVIVEGTTAVDTSALTGESLPVDKAEGDDVLSGSVNESGLIRMRVSSPYAQSTVAKILDMVEHASSRKSKSEKFVTKFARYYTPCVVFAALAIGIGVPLITGGEWMKWIYRACTFLVISCPCALVISIPLSFFAGIGGASHNGVLVKGSCYMESLAKAGTVVFDKTGTLTQGVFKVTAVHPNEVPEDELLDLAAAAELHSTHPIAVSIVQAHGGHIEEDRIGSVEEVAGEGIKAVIDGRDINVGNEKLMKAVGADFKQCEKTGTIIHVSEGSEYLGHIVVSDVVKPDSAQAISELRKLGVNETVMLTGDKKEVARETASEIGLDKEYDELLPGDKVDKVEQLLAEKGEGRTLAFVGDGINDAPVLKRADVGIAMGALGSDAAVEAADVVIMDDKPSKVALGIRIARKTLRLAHENTLFAIAVKFLILGLAAFGIVGMWWAVFADVGVMVICVLNSMRALRIK
ncbi:MAG: heavy metal translocating P-type ATPase [Anaerovoracaceae bacterium]